MNGYEQGLADSFAITNRIIAACENMSEGEADEFCKGYVKAIMEMCMFIEHDTPTSWM